MNPAGVSEMPAQVGAALDGTDDDFEHAMPTDRQSNWFRLRLSMTAKQARSAILPESRKLSVACRAIGTASPNSNHNPDRS